MCRTDRINIVDALDSTVFIHLDTTILECLDAAVLEVTGCRRHSNSHDNDVCTQDCLSPRGILKCDRCFRDLGTFGAVVEGDAFAFIKLVQNEVRSIDAQEKTLRNHTAHFLKGSTYLLAKNCFERILFSPNNMNFL